MSTRNRAHKPLMLKLILVAAGMFVFGIFAMPPLYARFCELTGIGQSGVGLADSTPENMVSDRSVLILLDATTNSALPWTFGPGERRIEVPLGEASETHYVVKSMANVATAGRAVYNVTPPSAAPYFVKTECFCFSRQTLQAGEQRDMPVRFYIDPDLPEDISEITLSYTFFLNPGSEADVAQTSTPGDS